MARNRMKEGKTHRRCSAQFINVINSAHFTVEIMVLNRVPFTLSQEKFGVTCFVKAVKMLVLNRVPFTFSQDILDLHAIGNTGKYAGDIGDVSSNSNEP